MVSQELLLFRKWSISEIEIKDLGLKTAISLKETIYPMDFGRSALKGSIRLMLTLLND